MTRQQFGLVLGNLGELSFQSFGNASVKCPSGFAQQRAVGRILNQCVLEQIARMRRYALAEEQTSGNKTV